MTQLNFLKSDTLENYLQLIQLQIIHSVEIQTYQSPYDQPNELREFKGFITGYLAGCLYLVKIKEYLNVKDFKNGDETYNAIFYAIAELVVPFYQHYVRKDKLIIGLVDNNLFKSDSGILLDISARIGKYQNEIQEGYLTSNPYFFEEWEELEYDEEWGNEIIGQKIYFEYIKLLFLTKIEEDNGKSKIEQFDVWELDDTQFASITSFVKTLCKIGNDIKINPFLFPNLAI